MSAFDVIVTGAEAHQTLVVMRSLHRRGVRMLVTGDRPRSAGFYSRHKAASAIVPSAIADKHQFVDELLDLAARHDIPYIFPVTETSLIALDEQRDRVDGIAKLLAPPSDTIRHGVDKKLTLAVARDVGVPVSATISPESIEEAEEFAEHHGYPVILKPRGRSNDARVGGRFEFKVQCCHDRAELRGFLSQFRDGVFPMMQEYAYGPHTQFMCFVEQGETIHSSFQDHMVRMLPLTGGVGARRLSCEIVPEVRDWSETLFRALNWEGCAQAQWKGPDSQGRYTFIEVSVRIIASIGSVVYSGVDHPWMQYQYFTGQTVDRAQGYVVGRHSRWFRGDALTVARYLIGKTPHSADTLPSKLRVLLSWLGDFFRPGLVNDEHHLSDPLPGIIELKDLFRDLWRLVRSRLGEKVPLLRAVKHRIAGTSANNDTSCIPGS